MHHQLSDSFAAADLESLVRVVIDQAHLELTAVARVDEAGGVEAGDTVLEGEPATGLDETGVSLGKSDGDTRGNQGPATSSGKLDVLTGDEVDPCIAGARVARKREVGIEAENS